MQIHMTELNPTEVTSLLDNAKILNKVTDPNLHMVIYTDGGFRTRLNNAGGWGYHGYVYTKEQPKNGHGCKTVIPQETGYVPINSEQSKGKGSVPAINVVKYIDGFGGAKRMADNNEAELMGLSNALKLVETVKPISVHFLLDSEYVLKGANEWIDKWRSNNWLKPNGTPVSNGEHWKVVDKQLQRVNEHSDVTWQWVKGHSGETGNETADKNATAGIYAAVNGDNPSVTKYIFTPVKEFWQPDYDAHPLIMTPFWYFIIGSQEAVIDTIKGPKRCYWTGTEGRRDGGKFVGNPDSEHAYCTVYLNDSIPVLEEVRQAQNRVTHRTNGYTVILSHLDTILSGHTHRDIVENGAVILGNHHIENSVLAHDKTVCHPLTPPYKALRAIDQLEAQDRRLNSIINADINDYYTLTEITNLIYDEVEVKKALTLKVKPDLGGNTSSFNVDANVMKAGVLSTVRICINLGIDSPRANAYGHFIDYAPRIFLVTWPEPESSKAIRYGIFIELTKTSEYALWESPYANLHIHL